ncbi:MAG: hypothetical protein HYT71_00545 [Candidatus Aenigmarchaeota archaeon]|nr:hypothetical protein [Candidatus Aenigmarchaeota archaeon]
MDQIAIMKKSWGFAEKILDRRKTIESRWYSSKRLPWNRINRGDIVYFKNSGEPVRIKATVDKVMQFSNLTPGAVMKLLKKYGKADGIEDIDKFYKFFINKKYCILVFLSNPKPVKPFGVDKKGFGAMSAWISVPDISRIRKKN